MRTIADEVAEHAFFRDLEPRYVELISGCGRNVKFEAGDYICRVGDVANEFYVIRHGQVTVELFVPHRGAVTIQTLEDGDILGWSWLVAPHEWRFDARALALTRAIVLDGTCLRGKCERDHDLGYELLKRFSHIVTERLEATRLQVLDVYGAHT